MSGKKPPPRPPLPKGYSSLKNTKAVNTPGRLRSALASISIRYNPTTAATKDSDSEEEIYIVRKEENALAEHKDDCSDEIDQNTRVTEDLREEPKQSANTSITNSSSCPLPLFKLSAESLNGVEKGLENGDKKTIVKQKTWPGNSIESSGVKSGSTEMKFIRRDQGAKNDPIKTNENKDEADSGSQPSKTHLSLSSMEIGNSDQKEGNPPRSPSPFRRLYRHANNDHTVGEKLAATSSAISLSSLLAAAATEDNDAEGEEENEEVEDFQDAMPEVPGDSLPLEEAVVNSEVKNSVNLSSLARPMHEPSCSFLLFCVLLSYIYLISNPPVFVNGMIAGSVICYLVGCLILLVVCPEDSFDERFQRELAEYNMHLAHDPKPSYTSVDPGLLLRPRGMKGWMLKAYDYDPNSVSETMLVYAQLRDNNLTLSLPKLDSSSRKIDIKTVDENTKLPFARTYHFDLTGSNIFLTPPTLSPKRIWSKKYPLCIALGKPGKVQEEVKELSEENSSKQKLKAQSSLDDVHVLYLFAKTGRQKEEWHQHFDRILNPKKNISVSDIDNLLRPTSCSYPHYMAKLLPNPDVGLQDSPEVQLSWVNMLFGRVFWDVWQDRYWADKIKQRFQNKLSKLHKPQFIRDIHITDLTLGHTFPLINKVSLPVLDEQGVWVDFDVTYSGGVVFTVETHLNIDGYLKHFLNLGKENRDSTGDLDMAGLTLKYEMLDKEEILKDMNEPRRDIGSCTNNDDDDESLTSESPPESDSDFESPESDFEDLLSKPNVSGSTETVLESSSYAKEALLQLKSLEGFLENQIAEEEEMQFLDVDDIPPQLRLSQESLSNVESISNSERNSPVQKQSSGEDSEKSLHLSPPSTPKMNKARDTSHASSFVSNSERNSPVQKQSSGEDSEKMSSVSAPSTPKTNKAAVTHHASSPVRQGSSKPTGTKKKLIGVLERLAKSKWVKKAAETKIVKTAAEKFSNLPIILSVEVQSVKGTLTLNIPPPPTNRLWYGFRGNPMLFVTARPKLGARQVKLTHVTDWIERKLKQEFKNMFVLPNMEDIPIKIMNSDVEKQFSDN